MKQSSPVKAGMFFFIIYLTVLLLTIFLPVIQLFTIFILPLPFIIYTSRFGWKAGAGLAAAVLIISGLIFPAVMLPFSFIAVFGGYMLGIAVFQQLSPYETWARGTLGYLAGLVSTFLFIQWVFRINIIAETESVIQSSVQSSREMIESFGLEFGEEDTALVIEQMEALLNLVPVFLVLLALLLAFLTQWLGYRLLGKLENKHLRFPPFREFQLPIAVIWLYFIAILATLFSGEEGSTVYLAATNVTNLAGVLVALQGLSFVFFYAYTKKLSKSIPLLAVIGAVFFPWIGLYLLRILGIIDLGFSLRERMKNDD